MWRPACAPGTGRARDCSSTPRARSRRSACCSPTPSQGTSRGLFDGFFDTRIGGKREPDSYDRIAIATGTPAASLLFLSDIEAELDAALSAGLRTCQMVRAADGTVASGRHPTAADFVAAATLFGLA